MHHYEAVRCPILPATGIFLFVIMIVVASAAGPSANTNKSFEVFDIVIIALTATE